MNILKSSLRVTFGLLGCVLFLGCSHAAAPSSTGDVTAADMALFEAKAQTMTLAEVCADVKVVCETTGEGCTCYKHFCQDKSTEQTVCGRLEDACVADCAADAVCEKACKVKDSKCGGTKGGGKGHHKGDKDDDADHDDDDDNDGASGSSGGSHDGADCKDAETPAPAPGVTSPGGATPV